MKIQCIDKTLQEVLAASYYKIPRFQRPYSWERENIEEFWNDAISDNDGDYFIGSIVVFREDGRMLGVVDGQQRLTTITMILCALRNAYEQESLKSLASGLHALIEKKDITNKMQFVIQTETSYPYFQEHIQKFGKPSTKAEVADEERCLKNAFDYFKHQIQSAIDASKTDPSLSSKKKKITIENKLNQIRDKILALKLIFIQLESDDDAYIIFETLNTRGKDLEPADIVKSYLTKLIRPKNSKVDIARDKWEGMVQLLQDADPEIDTNSFLHHYWLSKHEYITSKKLFKEVKRKVKKENANNFLDELCEDANTYRQIHETSFRKWTPDQVGIKNSLDALVNIFRVKQALPMILAILREYNAGRLKYRHVYEILSAIENFHFIFTAITSQRSSGGISFMYALHARDLSKQTSAENKIKVLRELEKKLVFKKPGFKEFEANFLELAYSDMYPKQKKLIQYILAKTSSEAVLDMPIDFSQATIEHIAAQSPKLGAPRLDEKITANVGNLILAGKDFNGKRLSSKGFGLKKSLLIKSIAKNDPIITKASQWTGKEISARAKYLANISYNKVWLIK